MPRIMRETEVARLLGIPVNSLRRWRREGHIKGKTLPAKGRPVVVDLDEVKRFLRKEGIHFEGDRRGRLLYNTGNSRGPHDPPPSLCDACSGTEEETEECCGRVLCPTCLEIHHAYNHHKRTD